MRLSLILTTLVAAVVVSAQGTGDVSPCIQQCSQQAATTAGCKDITQTSCICTSQAFNTAAAQCLQSTCSQADQQAAMGLQAALCAPYTNNSTVSSVAHAGMTTSTAAPTSSAAAAASNAPSASATTSSNSGSIAKVGFVSVLAVAFGAVGILA
ncbi:hypothetical protein FS837_006832 [Tulasnella sp. UAMH 9824]|nr:hypothetical protein FS837_006832 [Tulasnella sp. UAMH 9824]